MNKNSYKQVVIYLSFLLIALLIVGCPSSNNHNRANQTLSPNAKIKAEAAKGAVPPSWSRLAKINEGMNDNNVKKILGDPDDTDGYPTGKEYIPYYFGTDTSRVEWKYKGEGRIVFSVNRYSGGLKVIRIDYNSDELR